MWGEVRGNLRARHIPVMVLTIPLALFGILIAVISVAPWAALDESGFMPAFVAGYSIAVISAITAPKFRLTVTAVIVVAATVLSYPWPWKMPVTDPDAFSPYGSWAGLTAGGFFGVALVGLHLRSRWLLVLPAYFIGFLLSFLLAGIAGATVAPLLSPRFLNALSPEIVAWALLLPAGGAGGVCFASLTAPAHRRKVVWVTLALSVLLISGIYWLGIGASFE
jgi:hypothetical protein